MEYLLPFLMKSPFFWWGLAGLGTAGIYARLRQIKRRQEEQAAAFAEYEAQLAEYEADCAAAGVEPEYDYDVDGYDCDYGGAGSYDGGGDGD